MSIKNPPIRHWYSVQPVPEDWQVEVPEEVPEGALQMLQQQSLAATSISHCSVGVSCSCPEFACLASAAGHRLEYSKLRDGAVPQNLNCSQHFHPGPH